MLNSYLNSPWRPHLHCQSQSVPPWGPAPYTWCWTRVPGTCVGAVAGGCPVWPRHLSCHPWWGADAGERTALPHILHCDTGTLQQIGLNIFYSCLLCQPRIVRHMVTALLVFWDLVCGTICQKRSGVVVVCHLSRVHLKHIFSNSRLGFNIISSKYFLVTLNCVVCGCILGELFLIFA